MAIGWYIRDAKRDGEPVRIEVSVENGTLVLDVGAIHRRSPVRIEFEARDLDYVLSRARVESGDTARKVDPGLDPRDAEQILGITEVEDDFTPK